MNRRSCTLALALSLSAGAAVARPTYIRAPSSSVQGSAVDTARGVVMAQGRLPAGSQLASTRDARIPGGRRIVKLQQRHQGLRVLGRGAGVMFASDGHPALAAVDLARHFTSGSPKLTRQQATARAAKRHPRVFEEGHAELAWLPRGDSARLVWVFYRGLLTPLPLAPLLVLDATSGDVLLDVNSVVFDRAADVYELNPVSTPHLSQVALSALSPGSTSLTTPRLAVFNCIDKQTLGKSPFDFHVCETEQRATSDDNGDFLYDFPGDTAMEDEFAEVTMFYHASKAYDFFTSLGMPPLDAKPLNTFVNLRMPPGWSSFDLAAMQNLKLPLEPYNNAFYAPDNPFGDGFGPPGTGLWFGQGKVSDFAYDGDVVYHEFGHAVIDHTIDLSSHWHLDDMGASASPGAMNEGLADYFSSAMTGDGQVGEYAGKSTMGDGTSTSIRDLDNDHSCPKNLSGEVHTDSTLFSGGLWKVRQSLVAADRSSFDAAILSALLMAPSGDLGYEDLAELMALSVEGTSLGLDVATALRGEMTARGVLPRCLRVLEFEGAPLMGPEVRFSNAFFAPGKPKMVLPESAPYAPGLLQVHWKLPAGAKALRVDWGHLERQSQSGYGPSPDPYAPALLVQFTAEPITFEYEPELKSSAGEPHPVVRIGDSYRGEVAIPEGASDVHLMIVNQGDREALYYSVSLAVPVDKPHTGGTAGMPSGGSGGTDASGGSGGSSAATPAAPEELHPAGGCSSATASKVDANWLWLLIGFASLRLRRRRSALVDAR